MADIPPQHFTAAGASECHAAGNTTALPTGCVLHCKGFEMTEYREPLCRFYYFLWSKPRRFQTCACLLILCLRNKAKSDWVQTELKRALFCSLYQRAVLKFY